MHTALLFVSTCATLVAAGVVRVRVDPENRPQVVRLVPAPRLDASDYPVPGSTRLASSGSGRFVKVVKPIIRTEPQPQALRVVQPQPAPVIRTVATVREEPSRQLIAQPARQAPARVQIATATEEPVTDVPKPYSIAYDSVDGNGTQMRREETKDDKGVIRGSYSYTDPYGIFRVVEYIADENGFRASIRTNEPGVAKTENGDPAGINYEIDERPAELGSKR